MLYFLNSIEPGSMSVSTYTQITDTQSKVTKHISREGIFYCALSRSSVCLFEELSFQPWEERPWWFTQTSERLGKGQMILNVNGVEYTVTFFTVNVMHKNRQYWQCCAILHMIASKISNTTTSHESNLYSNIYECFSYICTSEWYAIVHGTCILGCYVYS